MLKTSKSFAFILVYMLIMNSAYSQLMMNENLLNEVKQKLTVKYGPSVIVNFIYQIDSLEHGNSQYPSPYKINDMYGTLQNTTIFTAIKCNSPCKGLVGVYKNGDIIWDSDTTINCEDDYGDYTGLTVFSISDLNKDGVLDLLFSSSRSGPTPYSNIQRLYIYSFDGNNGHLISENNGDNTSTLNSFLGVGDFNFVDVDGDGIYEITGFWYLPNNDDVKTVTYYWAGINYVFDPARPQPQPYEFLIQNNINTFTKSIVEKDSSDFIYNYKIKNLITGKQEINAIYFRCGVDSAIENFLPTGWISVNLNELLGFEDIHVPTLYENNHFIRIDSLKIFKFKADGLPSLVTLFVQGYNKTPPLEDTIDGHVITFQDFYNNVISNSYSSPTIGPSDLFYSLNEQEILDSIINYNNQSYQLNWITNQTTSDKFDSLFTSAKTQLQQNNNNAARTTLQTVLQEVDLDSTDNLTSEAYALLRYNTEYLLEQIPQSSPNLLVTLTSSQGSLLLGGSLKYYDAGWKDAIDNGDGTFTVITERTTVSLRMTYEYGKQTVHNVPAQDTTYTFQTVNAAVELRNSLGNLIDEGTVKYYAGGWRDFGTTANGVANKELLPINYSFRMSYEYGSIDKQQNLSTDPTVVFQTVNAAVELRNSLGNLIDEGTVKYYAGAWRTFGTTVNGVVTKELLPKNYSFRMTYEYISNDKQQDLSTNSTITFSTVLCTVKVTNANNQPLENAEVKYYSGAWRDIGLTNIEGITTKEMLPKTLSFRAIYGSVSEDKQQDIGINNLVEFILNTQ